ncbi:MAG: hypothetical protein ACREQ3_25440, partial [Candidatus Binatia bacterium]
SIKVTFAGRFQGNPATCKIERWGHYAIIQSGLGCRSKVHSAKVQVPRAPTSGRWRAYPVWMVGVARKEFFRDLVAHWQMYITHYLQELSDESESNGT